MSYDDKNRNPNAEPFNIDLNEVAQNPEHRAQIMKDNEGSAGERDLNPDPGLPGELGEIARCAAHMVGISQSAANLVALTIWASCIQAHYDAPTLAGHKPTSLFAFIILPSGERKTTLNDLLMEGVRQWQKDQRKAYNLAEQTFKKAKQDGADLSPPEFDERIFENVTLEALVQRMGKTKGVALWESSEAGLIIGGHNMTAEKRMAFFTGTNRLWDGTMYSSHRVTSGASYIPKPRLSINFAAQLEAAQKLIGDKTADDTGIIARFLFVQPEPLAGQRQRYTPTSQDWALLEAFQIKTKAALERPLPTHEGEICPIALEMAPEARKLIEAYYDEIEPLLATGGIYEEFRANASKSVEQACRIAACLAVWRNLDNPVVEAQDMKPAINLARFYLNEAKRVMGIASTSKGTRYADEMLRQLKVMIGDQQYVTASYIYNNAKKPFSRQRELIDKTLAELEKSGQIKSGPGPTGGKRYMLVDV